jgi:uncharacterized membrane protein
MGAVWRRLSQGYWAIPAVCVVGAGVLALVLVAVDEQLQAEGFVLSFGGGPDSARALLSTVSTSMMSLTALTFSITMVVLQLASSQFSPRAIPTFLRDRQNQLTLGVFLATYVYALLALREIRGTDADLDQFVPGVTIGLAFLLVLVSIGFFVAYIHHIATSIQVGFILQRIERETRRVMRREFPGDDEADVCDEPTTGSPRHIIEARGGVVADVDVRALVSRRLSGTWSCACSRGPVTSSLRGCRCWWWRARAPRATRTTPGAGRSSRWTGATSTAT